MTDNHDAEPDPLTVQDTEPERPPESIETPPTDVRRQRVRIIGAAAGLLLLLFGVLTIVQVQRIVRERERATSQAAAAQQVSDFLVSLFEVSDPTVAGNTPTRDIVDAGAQRVEEEFDSQPDLQARLETTLAKIYANLGLYREAEQEALRAVNNSRAALGPTDPQTLVAIDALADAYWLQGHYRRTEPLYTEVIAAREQLLGPDHRDTLKTKFHLARLYSTEKRWPDAEQLARTTLDAQRRTLGEDDPDTIDSLNSLVVIYAQQHKDAEAVPFAKLVVERRERQLGNDHPDTLTALHNLATLSETDRGGADAERLYVRALEGKRRVLGASHPDTANTMTMLGRLYLKQKRYGEAEPLLVGAFESRRAAFGDDDERIRGIAGSLVELYKAAGDPKSASMWESRLKP